MKFILILFILLAFENCFAKEIIKLIYDNDAGADDAIALIYLSRQPSISIEGITISTTGEAHGQQGAQNMVDLCHFLDKPNIPIAYGKEKNKHKYGHVFPNFIRESADKLFIGKPIILHAHEKIGISAIELMKKIIEKNQKTSFLVTGPLTNIADLIQRYPHLKSKIEKIVVMGGAIHVKGNIPSLDSTSKNSVAEWNIYADPKSADIVFSSGIPVVLVPLDATNKVPITKDFYTKLSQESQPELRLIYLLLKDNVNDLGMEKFLKEFYLWDPLAAVIFAHSSRAIMKTLPISIDLKTGQTKKIDKAALHFSILKVITDIENKKIFLKQFINDMRLGANIKNKEFKFNATIS